MNNGRLPFLLLSIQRIHADRIFSGAKLFELRKMLPKARFGMVFLYQTGGGGVVGSFRSGEPVCLPTEKLWNLVREKGTSSKRFWKYFKRSSSGWAIPVKYPRRFGSPLELKTLRTIRGFRPPLNCQRVHPRSALYNVLQRRLTVESKELKVRLAPISRKDRDLYVDLVTEEIAPKYDDITEDFARSNLRTHHLGEDPNGIFTQRKDVLKIETESGNCVGFTTLTYKVGKCLKTGPTVLLHRFRHRGYGLAARKKILEMAKAKGIRKLYCTCPDNDQRILAHLFRSGFTVEAHLRQHYSAGHGEIVFGHVIKTERDGYGMPVWRRNTLTRPRILKSVPAETSVSFLLSNLKSFWNLREPRLAKAIIRSASQVKHVYEEKPCDLIFFGRGRTIDAAVLLTPKRGGSLKALWFPVVRPKWFDYMFGEIERFAIKKGRRKIYFVHPAEDIPVLHSLRKNGCIVEGLLKEPYSPNRDAVILSKIVA